MTIFRSMSAVRACAALGALLLALFALPAVAQEAPDALVKRVSQEALQVIKTDPKVQAGDQARVRELIETKLAPHFDVDRMTALAAGRAYRSATPEQKKQLADQFRTLLIRTYSTALNQYRDQTIEYRPLKMAPTDTEVVVRSLIKQKSGADPIDINYSMEKTDAGWKVYDVVIAGVSLVQNYRSSFASEIQKSGVDGLIATLVAKNKTLGQQVTRK